MAWKEHRLRNYCSSIISNLCTFLQPISFATIIATHFYIKSEELSFVLRFTSHFIWLFYVMLPALFLCTLTWNLSELFAQICKEMERAFAEGQDVGHIAQESGVCHSLICQAVWRLEEFFGNVMLVDVACIFVSCINFCVLLLDDLGNGIFTTWATYLFGALSRFIALEAIGSSAERLKNKVHFVSSKILS